MTETIAIAFVGLGTNLDDRQLWLTRGRDDLGAIPGTHVRAESPIYETRPVGPVQDQGAFLNQVVELATTLNPEALLDALAAIELRHGRRREVRWGPRTLDLDLIAWVNPDGSTRQMDTPRLTLPHPRARRRDFVLVPLNDLAPTLRLGAQTVSELLATLDPSERAVLRSL